MHVSHHFLLSLFAFPSIWDRIMPKSITTEVIFLFPEVSTAHGHGHGLGHKTSFGKKEIKLPCVHA